MHLYIFLKNFVHNAVPVIKFNAEIIKSKKSKFNIAVFFVCPPGSNIGRFDYFDHESFLL